MLPGRYREFMLDARDSLILKIKAKQHPGGMTDTLLLCNAVTDTFRNLLNELDQMEREILQTIGKK